MGEGGLDQAFQKATDWVASKIAPGGFPTVPEKASDNYLVDTTLQPNSRDALKVPQEYRQIEPGDVLPGAMVIVPLGEERAEYNARLKELFPNTIGDGKWSTVLEKDSSTAIKIFNQPDNFYSACEVVFMQEYGGQAGLPEFKGTTINGYHMEKIVGKTLSQLQRESTENTQIISKSQAQELLNKVAQYHQTTQRVHGDLATAKGPENIMLDENGKIRICDTEWERIGEQTPKNELLSVFDWLTQNLKIEGLELPETISDEAAIVGLNSFIEKVRSRVEFDVYGSVDQFTSTPDNAIKITSSGSVYLLK